MRNIWNSLLETHAIHMVWLILIPGMWFGFGVAWVDIFMRGSEVSLVLLLICWILGLLTVGTYLYFLRCRHRLVYGLIETAAAIAIIAVTLVSVLNGIGYKREAVGRFLWMEGVAPWLQLAAALYIFVRGLDNMGEGLKQHPRILECWRRVFPVPEEKKANV